MGLTPAVAPETPVPDNPVADPKAVVVYGNARFTVLTPELIRMEWSADGKFEDHASLVFINRRLPVPKFEVNRSVSGSAVVIDTYLQSPLRDTLTLTYIPTGDGRFTAENLSIELTVDGKSSRLASRPRRSPKTCSAPRARSTPREAQKRRSPSSRVSSRAPAGLWSTTPPARSSTPPTSASSTAKKVPGLGSWSAPRVKSPAPTPTGTSSAMATTTAAPSAILFASPAAFPCLRASPSASGGRVTGPIPTRS